MPGDADGKQSVLGKHLAASDKRTRDRAVEALEVWLRAQKKPDEMALLKLWKALYYCALRAAIPFCCCPAG